MCVCVCVCVCMCVCVCVCVCVCKCVYGCMNICVSLLPYISLTINLCSGLVFKRQIIESCAEQRTLAVIKVDKSGTVGVIVTIYRTRGYTGIIQLLCWRFYWFRVVV